MGRIIILQISSLIIILARLQDIQTFILEEDIHGDYEHFVAVPVKMDHVTDKQYFHIYITADTETTLEITLHGTYLYRAARLMKKNDWSWHECFYISEDLQESAYSKGFHIVADHPVTVLLTRNGSTAPSLITYTALPLPKWQHTKHIIGSLPPAERAWQSSQFLVATGRNGTTISAYGPGSSTPTIADLSIDPYTVYEYSVDEPRTALGFRLTSTNPAAVYGRFKLSSELEFQEIVDYYGFYQVPSVIRLGTQYVVGPWKTYIPHQYYRILVVSSDRNASIRISHSAGHEKLTIFRYSSVSCSIQYNTSGVCTISCLGDPSPQWYVEVGDISADQAVIVDCSVRCLVFLVVEDAPEDDNMYEPSLFALTCLVAPPRPLPAGLHFFVPFVEDDQHRVEIRVNIAVPEAARDGLLIDGIPINELEALLKYATIAVSTWIVISVDLKPGNHRVVHEASESVPISIHIHGSDYSWPISVFGYPAAYPEASPTSDGTGTPFFRKSAATISSKPTSDATRHHHSVTVAGIILLIVVILAVLGVVIIGVRNSALLRAIIYGQLTSLKKEHRQSTQNEKQNIGLDEKVEIDERQKADETDGDMYLVPTSDRPRYERIRPGTAETNLDQHDVTYDTIT